MNFRDVLVHLDASEQGERRATAAMRLAKAFDAQLTGLYAIPPDPVPYYALGGAMAGGAAVAALGDAPDPFESAREEVRGRFAEHCEREGVRGSWCEARGPISAVVAMYARFADLVIAGQDAPEPEAGQAPVGLAADLALSAGRPVLAIPHAGDYETIGARPLVAWSPTRESARALHDAMPFLARAEAVEVRTIVEDDDRQASDTDEPALDVAAHLRRHDIEAEWHRTPSELDIADELLARITDGGHDLLVMGAYGHSRMREFVFGGATRGVLSQMTAPVLFSN